MKELSIEEKAKLYDEAIKVAKSNYETIVQMDNDCTFAKEGIVNTFHHIFPELKENENKRIRKDIERAISVALDYCYFNKETANNCLAWLEKQGEDKKEDSNILQRFSFYSYKDEPNILYLAGVFVNEEYRNKGIGSKMLEVADEVAKSMRCNTIRLKVKKDTDAYRLYLKKGYNILTNEGNQVWLEKHTSNADNANKEYWRGYREGKQEILDKYAELEKQSKQKPIIEMKSAEESLGIDSETYSKIVDECIYGEQKPTWSEEDESLNTIADRFIPESTWNALEESKGEGSCAAAYDYSQMIAMFKAGVQWLKDRYTWKPSESDILLLEKIANGKSNPQDFQASLWGLIGQLKKLRE